MKTAEEAILLAVMEQDDEEALRLLRDSTPVELRVFTTQVSHLADLIADVRAEKATEGTP